MTQPTKYWAKYWLALLLGLSGIALSVLVPGGPIETRSFAHIHPVTLGIFNTFLTVLGLGSFLLIYFVLKAQTWATIAGAGCGLAYVGVYGLDLAQIFPVSPDPMPLALWAIEVFGLVIAIPLIGLSIVGIQSAKIGDRTSIIPSISTEQLIYTIGLLLLLGCSIIAFATRSAMGYL